MLRSANGLTLRTQTKCLLSALTIRKGSVNGSRRRISIQASKAKSNFSKVTKKTTAPPVQADPATPQPAPRIDPSSNISVRRQQRFVKLKKAFEVAASKPPTQTQTKAFRKTKLDPEERAEINKQREEEAAHKTKIQSDRASLTNLYGTNGDESPPMLLVDGYNVLMQWKHLHPHDALGRIPISQLEQARSKLEEDLVTYSQTRKVKVVVVYDAMGRTPDPLRIDIPRSVRETKAGAIDVVFCSDQEADSWILKETVLLKATSSCPYVVVASGDRVLSDSVASQGAFITPAKYLVDEVKKAVKEVQDALRESQYKFGRSSLSQGMSQADSAKLAQRRQQLVDIAKAGRPTRSGPSLTTQGQLAKRRHRHP